MPINEILPIETERQSTANCDNGASEKGFIS